MWYNIIYYYSSKTKTLKDIYNKSNFIELKTLEYYFDGDTKKARDVYKIRHCLKSDGFELFIKFYFQKLGLKMKKWIWWHKADWGIDLHWEIGDQKIYIQCKKYIKNHTYKGKINVWEVRNFFWWVVSMDKAYENAMKIFVNTWDFTSYALDFWKNNDIEIWNYEDIASICEVYNYESFLNELKAGAYDLNRYISYQQSWMIPFLQEELNEEDIFIYLSNIREKLAGIYESDMNIGYIYRDDTLKIFAKQRPHNLEALKEISKSIKDSFEKSHVQKYWKEIIKGLEILKLS